MVQGKQNTNSKPAFSSQPHGLGHDHTVNFGLDLEPLNFDHNQPVETIDRHRSPSTLVQRSSKFQLLNIDDPLFLLNWEKISPVDASVPDLNSLEASRHPPEANFRTAKSMTSRPTVQDPYREDRTTNMVSRENHRHQADRVYYPPPPTPLILPSNGEKSVRVQNYKHGKYDSQLGSAFEQQQLNGDHSTYRHDSSKRDVATSRKSQYLQDSNHTAFQDRTYLAQNQRNSQPMPSARIGSKDPSLPLSSYRDDPFIDQSLYKSPPAYNSQGNPYIEQSQPYQHAEYSAFQPYAAQYSYPGNQAYLPHRELDNTPTKSFGVVTTPSNPFDSEQGAHHSLGYNFRDSRPIPFSVPNRRQPLPQGVHIDEPGFSANRMNRKRTAALDSEASNDEEHEDMEVNDHRDGGEEEEEAYYEGQDEDNDGVGDDEDYVPTPSRRNRPTKQRRTSGRNAKRRHQESDSDDQAPPPQAQRPIGPRTINVPTNYHARSPGEGFDGKPKHWCRFHKREGFQVGKNRIGPWQNAIRHDDLRSHLYNQARAQGTFRYPREAGTVPGDLTSFHPQQKDWSFDPDKRRRWPKVLFQFKADNTVTWGPPRLTESQGDWIWQNRVVVDRDNRPLRVWPLLNSTCSSQFEAGALEALFRMCPGMTARDIFGRTPDVPSVPKNSTGFNARRNRFRDRNGLISWTARTGSDAMWQAVEKKIGAWGVQHNSTQRFAGFNEDELEEVKQVNKTSSATIKKSLTHQKRIREEQQQERERRRAEEQDDDDEEMEDEEE